MPLFFLTYMSFFVTFLFLQSFFGRTYNNVSSISECKNNGECTINKKNRTACKACRLRKCLLVGMSKSGSRYGRRSNWFKIHCLLQEQQQKNLISNNSNGNQEHVTICNIQNPSASGRPQQYSNGSSSGISGSGGIGTNNNNNNHSKSSPKNLRAVVLKTY